MEAKFEIFRGVNGQYYFRLKAPNGEIICQSEGYKSKFECIDTVMKIKEYAPNARIVDLT